MAYGSCIDSSTGFLTSCIVQGFFQTRGGGVDAWATSPFDLPKPSLTTWPVPRPGQALETSEGRGLEGPNLFSSSSISAAIFPGKQSFTTALFAMCHRYLQPCPGCQTHAHQMQVSRAKLWKGCMYRRMWSDCAAVLHFPTRDSWLLALLLQLTESACMTTYV